jgi:hypothetical protein
MGFARTLTRHDCKPVRLWFTVHHILGLLALR